MKLSAAKSIADKLVSAMNDYCERVIVAGSIRREKPEVKDVEIVALPKWSFAVPKELDCPSTAAKQVKTYSSDHAFALIPSNYELFGDADTLKDDTPKGGAKHNLLWLWANRQNIIRWIKPGTAERITWDVKPDGKYWRGVIENEDHAAINLDLFLTRPDNWGVISVIRTGPSEFSHALVGYLKTRTKFRVDKGCLWNEDTGDMVACETEEELFTAVGLRFVPVGMRSAADPYSLFRLGN